MPFFSELALTRIGPAMIAMRWQVPVVPVFIVRQGTSARHVVMIQPALEIEGLGLDPLPDAAESIDGDHDPHIAGEPRDRRISDRALDARLLRRQALERSRAANVSSAASAGSDPCR